METKYVTVFVKGRRSPDQPQNPKRISIEGILWKAVAVIAILSIIFLSNICVHSISQADELSKQLLEAKTELLELKQEYNRLQQDYELIVAKDWSYSVRYTSTSPAPIILDDQGTSDDHTEDTPGQTESPVVETATPDPEPTVELMTPEPVIAVPAMYKTVVPLNEELVEYIYDKSIANDINPQIIFALGWHESRYTPDAISPSGDYGLFQINVVNHDRLAAEFGVNSWDMKYLLMDPYFCTDCMIYMIRELIDDYHFGDYHSVLMAYNMGPGGAMSYINAGVYASSYSISIETYATNTFGLQTMSL